MEEHPERDDNPEVGANQTLTGYDQPHAANDEKENVGPLTGYPESLMMGHEAETNKQLEASLSQTSPGIGWSPGIALSSILWKQIRSLQSKERELDEGLARQRVEHLVERVENEVELEGAVEEYCSRLRAEEEAAESLRREREWELERREVRLEEQVVELRDQVRRLEEELRMAQQGGGGGGGEVRTDVEEAIQRLLAEVRAGSLESEPTPSPSRAMLVAFEDLLKESDERHERERQALEERLRVKEEAEAGLRHERHRRRAREKQMESQMVAMHKEITRLTSLLKEREHSVSVEKERRSASQDEVARLAGTAKEERAAHRVAMVKLKKLESFFSRLREKLSRELSESENEFLRNLEKDVGRLSAIFNLKKELPRPAEAEQLEAARRQLEAAVAERDKAEEKISMLLKRSRDREAEIDAMWLEREKLLIDRAAAAEEQAEQLEAKLGMSEERFSRERAALEQEVTRVRDACDEEKRAMEAMIAERDAWMKQQDDRLQSLLESKEHEILMLKTVQQKLLNTLASSRNQLQPGSGDEIDVQSFERMASELGAELESRAKEMRAREEAHENERRELGLEAEKLGSERRELQEKVCETLALMEELRREIEAKEKQMAWETKEMEAIVAAKNEEIESLKRELDEKDLELEIRVEKFQSEMQMIEVEIEKERREREKIMDSHFASKKMLANEAQLKEEFWERDANRMAQEITSLRGELRKKVEELERLKLEACSRESERERLEADRKEAEEENARLRSELQRSNNSDSEFLGSESSVFEERRNAEWQSALGRVAVFDKQIGEAMQAIQTLREELSAKEAELQRARNEPEMELERVEDHKAIFMEKSEVLKLLESERSEASDTIALLHGTIRELQWALMRRGSKESFGTVEELVLSSKKVDMVKVHASHLKEVDEFIRELKARVEELEKMRYPRTDGSGALVAEKRVVTTRDEELDEALLNVEREMMKYSPERRPRVGFAGGVEESSPRSRARSMGSAMDQPGTSSDRTWNLGGALSCVAMKDTIEHRWLPQEIPGQDPLALALPSSRQQKKWIVDASWIEQVRKEHLLLTQQLALERQRVAALGQVEAENRWLEAMMVRAIQQKKDFELKLSQQKSWGLGRSS